VKRQIEGLEAAIKQNETTLSHMKELLKQLKIAEEANRGSVVQSPQEAKHDRKVRPASQE
jgi:hypothetical protein